MKEEEFLKDNIADLCSKASVELMRHIAYWEIGDIYEKELLKIFKEFSKSDEFKKLATERMRVFVKDAFSLEDGWEYENDFRGKIARMMESEMLKRLGCNCNK